MVGVNQSRFSSAAPLKTLANAGLLDNEPDEAFDRLTRLARRLLDAPAALIVLIGPKRMVLKSVSGLPEPLTDRELAALSRLCRSVAERGQSLSISDTSGNVLPNDLLPRIGRSIGGCLAVPISGPAGDPVGAFCIFSHESRAWSQEDEAALADLGRAAASEIAARVYRLRCEFAESALNEGEARTAEILESIDEAFYALDRQWQFTYVNCGAERIWGHRRDELLGRSIFEVLPDFAGSESHLLHKKAIADRQAVRGEIVGRVLGRPIEISIYPSQAGMSVYFRDVSDRQRIENELRQRNDILTLAEASAGIGVWDVDLATGLVRGTPQFFRIMGLDPSDEGVPIDLLRALRHPDDRDRVIRGFHQAVTSGTDAYEMEYRILRPDGATRWIFGRGRVIRNASGKPVRYSGIDIDVTDRKAAEAALAESEERLRLAQEAAGIGVWDWDIVTGALRWSENQWKLHGLEQRPGTLVYDAWKNTIYPEDRDRASAAVAEAVAAKKPYEVEYRVKLPGGEIRWIAQLGTVISDAADRPVRMLGVSVDITDRRATTDALARLNQELEGRVRQRTMELEAEAAKRAEAEARLHQAQKMEAVGELTGGIAHDFNNILTVIIGNLDMLKRRLAKKEAALGGLAEKFSRPVDFALQGARNAAQLTQRLLAFGRRQPLDPTVIDLNELVAGVSNMIRRTLSETIRLETVLTPGVWPTFADANQLESSLLNLVVNARDAMPEGGVLTIETKNVPAEEARAGEDDGAPSGDYVMLRVSDTGCGMPKDTVERVFEPFFTTKEPGKGSGLGLSMVYGFVRQSGGRVGIDSEVGRGTSVRLYLPRMMEPVSPSAPTWLEQARGRETVPGARPGETVLVVEDNEDVRRYGVAALKYLGYRVLEAADGPEALRLLDVPDRLRIDLLFTDMVLPGGMNGRALADRVEKLHPGLPVLFTTGYTRTAIFHHDRLDPHAQLLSKPYTLETLALKVRQLIDTAQDADASLD